MVAEAIDTLCDEEREAWAFAQLLYEGAFRMDCPFRNKFFTELQTNKRKTTGMYLIGYAGDGAAEGGGPAIGSHLLDSNRFLP